MVFRVVESSHLGAHPPLGWCGSDGAIGGAYCTPLANHRRLLQKVHRTKKPSHFALYGTTFAIDNLGGTVAMGVLNGERKTEN